jgi:sugar lactone lactonase YvrE
MRPHVVVRETLVAPGLGPAGLTWDGKTLWHADYRAGQIFGLDPRDGSVRRSLYCPGNLSGLAWDGRALWQSLFDQEMIRCVNPDTNDFDETIILSGQGWLSGVAWDSRRLWVVAQQAGKLLSIDLNTNEINSPISAPIAMGDIDFRDGYLWASIAVPMRFDQELGRFEWLSDSPEYAVVQLDPADGRVVTRFASEYLYSGLCWVEDELYLSHGGSRSILRAHLESG